MMKNQHTPYDLDNLVQTYDIDNVYEHYKRLEFITKMRNYIAFKNSKVLELGSASGQMTLMLSQEAKQVVAVDGSAEFIKIAQERTRGALNVQFNQSYFESFSLDETFDCLILHHILEHLENPPLLLTKLKAFMHKDSLLAITVPNAHALSRQLAVKMGLLSSVYELTENDRHHGHFRVYDWKTLEEQVVASGFNIIGKHGLSFKLFSDKQNLSMLDAQIIGEEQIKGLWKIGDEFPDVAGAIMIVAKGV